jgi:hypothetical protein
LIELAVSGKLRDPVVAILFEACEARGYHLLLTRQPPAGGAPSPRPVVDARIVLDPDASAEPGQAEEPTVVLLTSDLSPAELAKAAEAAVENLVDQAEGRARLT